MLLLDTVRGKFNFIEIYTTNFQSIRWGGRGQGLCFHRFTGYPSQSKRARTLYPVGWRNNCNKKNKNSKKIPSTPCMPQTGVKFKSTTHFSPHTEVYERLCDQLVKPCLFKEQTSTREVLEYLIWFETCK